MRRIRLSIPTFLSFAVLFATASAEAGTLSGTARTVEGAPLPQVIFSLEGSAGVVKTVVGPEGRYRVDSLAPGDYHVTCSLPGLVLQGDARVHIDDGAAHLDLVFGPAPVREHVLVAATRDNAPLSTLGVNATVLDGQDIAQGEPSDFIHLLQSVPGVAVARSGGVGLQASAFVRGGESNFARVLVDGVPVNEPGGVVNWGGQFPLELDRVEVVRGAASSLYGTDALAGVIQLVTRGANPGEGGDVRAEAEGGSFAWRRFNGGTSGRRGDFDWNLGAVRLDTDNQEPNSDFSETAVAATVGARLGDHSTLRFVVRGEDSKVGTPGPTAFGRADLDAHFDASSIVTGGSWHWSDGAVSHGVNVGFARSNQLSVDPLDSGSYTPSFGGHTAAFPYSDFPDPLGFQNNVRRLSAGYQAEARAGSANLITVGGDLEHETGDVGSRSGDLLSPSRTNVGAYVQDRIVVGSRVFVTLGGRLEHNDNFGTKVVPRAAIAWRLASTASGSTTLRASAGAGIKEPSFFQSFGVSIYAKGNPNLKPERSHTFDVGLEQRLAGDRFRVEASYFHHDYLDQVAYQVTNPETFEATYVNLGKTRARGLELALEAAPVARLRFGAEYTYLDGKVIVSSSDFDPVYAVGQPLLRRPRHQGSAWIRSDVGRVTLGMNLVSVGIRADSDFVGIGLTENKAYTRVDARAQIRLTSAFEAFVVSENLFDTRCQEVLGYPALGRSVRAGIRFRKPFHS